jgi:cytochrome c
MNSFRLNKILGTILGTLLVLQTIRIVDGAFAPGKIAEPAPVKEQPPAVNVPPIEPLLASASAERGQESAKPCGICHNFQEGQGPKIGPDLYGVVGRPVASVPGFNYSAALKAKGGTWTFPALNAWIANPRADVPGTTMTFPGIPNENRRAEVIVYLNTLSHNPLPLPQATSGK